MKKNDTDLTHRFEKFLAIQKAVYKASDSSLVEALKAQPDLLDCTDKINVSVRLSVTRNTKGSHITNDIDDNSFKTILSTFESKINNSSTRLKNALLEYFYNEKGSSEYNHVDVVNIDIDKFSQLRRIGTGTIMELTEIIKYLKQNRNE